jgi:tRNA U55 pseudouridine synthase TruB
LYSAIRVDGERLYAIARNVDPKKTRAEDVAIPTREVEIYGLEVQTSLDDDVIRSGMVDGPRYREEASRIAEELAAAASAAVTEATEAVDEVQGDVDETGNDHDEGGVGGVGGRGGGGGGSGKRKRGGKRAANNDNDKNNNKKDQLFDEVTVPSIRHDESILEMPRFALSVNCGGGTYIRSLVRDIGYELGTVATMTGLVRTKQGPFVLEDALTKEDWNASMIYDAIRRGGREVVRGDTNDIDLGAVVDIRGGGQKEEEREEALEDHAPESFYHIGTPGIPWTDVERNRWKSGMKVQRSYKEDVLDFLNRLDDDVWDVVRYGALSHDPERYPLYGVRNRDWSDDKPCVFITGGVHGYETSGVQGAILFLQTLGKKYAENFNILVIPCVSPWAYEHVQRWNADLRDVNRSFKVGSETDESRAVLSYLDGLGVDIWTCHVDLHETTDTDATEFMPAKHAEAGLMYKAEEIPDGFYLACDSENSQLDFQDAIIASVHDVTHIAPPNDDGNIIGVRVVRDGVISLPVKELGLCCGCTGAKFTTTTEVYPDSPRATDEICNRAQLAAIVGAFEYVISSSNK